MSAISVKLQAFEGPLDLLLHLIEKNKVNIYDIPVVEITRQYLEYLDEMQRQDLNVMSEFLVMAATLIDIKAKMLLPPEVDEEGEEIDPRDELVEKLLEYKMYKYMSYELRDRETLAEGQMYRQQDLPDEVKTYREPVDLDDLLKNVSLTRLNAVFQDIMKRQEERMDPVRSKFGQIEKDEVDLNETMSFVEQQIMSKKTCSFSSLLLLRKGRMYKVVTFLTILELMKIGKISVMQEETFGEILIAAREKQYWNMEELSDESMDGNEMKEELEDTSGTSETGSSD